MTPVLWRLQLLALLLPASHHDHHARVQQGRKSTALTTGSRRSNPQNIQANLDLKDPRILTVSLDRTTGIDFGSDLALRWPYVLALTPNGDAMQTGQVQINDQLLAINGQSVVGARVADAMDLMAAQKGATVEFVFFRGSREELQRIYQVGGNPASIIVTIQSSDGSSRDLELPYGANLRDELIARGINVYQSVTRWTNCNGKQLCGTCIVDVVKGMETCTRRSVDEASTLRENPPSYKLACITNMYGNVTIRLMPKVGAAQWTR